MKSYQSKMQDQYNEKHWNDQIKTGLIIAYPNIKSENPNHIKTAVYLLKKNKK